MNKKNFLSSVMMLVLFYIPVKVLAHGDEEHAVEEVINYWNYGLIPALLLSFVAAVLFVLTKIKMKNTIIQNKDSQKKYNTLSSRSTFYLWFSIVTLILTIFFLLMSNISNSQGTEEKHATEEITFTHLHGLGYTSNGEELYVPSHDGLRLYENGTWSIPSVGEKHDYMGFTMFNGGFYSSGHPDPQSDLANPLGIVKSTDKGETLELLDLYEEVDFHGMTVGYETQDIYLFNPMENSRMDQPGFYYSTDETSTWNQSGLLGLEGQATTLAAHPTEKGTVAIGTDQGVFISHNYGDNFEELTVEEAVSAVSFDHQNHLLVGTQSGALLQINQSTNEINKLTELTVPNLDENNPITFVKQNPADHDELVFTTTLKDIYISNDGGESWDQIVDKGIAVSHH